ncbi:MAG TPA: signal peptide peptidase SppA [Caulobacteraceae bacterium]|jgi:protease-4
MKQFLLTLAGVFTGLLLFFIGLPLVILVMAAGAPRPAAGASVLNLDLRQEISDQDSKNPLAAFGAPRLSVLGVVQTLRHAERDDHIKGLLIRLPEGGVAPAAADELRLAVKRFRAAGKPVYAHSQGLYPVGAATSTYMLGAAADQLWMQPGAMFEAAGIASEDLFFKRLFDKYGVKPEFEQREQYKNAVNPFLYSDYTSAHKQGELSWMGSVYRTALVHAAADRRRDPAALRAAVESAPLSSADAVARGLIDRQGQVQEAEAELRRRAGGAKLVDFGEYAAMARGLRSGGSGPAIAVVEAEGPIINGTADNGSVWSGDQTIYADDLARALRQATEDDDVKAIVMRVSSPGGSDTASEEILAAVRQAKAAGKPVVVSMGTYGASGGYWIASEASAILAHPSTLTGSIGVFGGKFAVGEALARFGVDARQTQVGGEFASAYSLGRTFTPAQRAAYARAMDLVYRGFIERVARGRKLSPERVRQIAQGRVWTGEQARTLGLVDELGGFYQAVERAKTLAGIKGGVRLKRMAQEVSPFEALGRAFGVSAENARVMAAAAWIFGDPRAKGVMDQLLQARMQASGARVLADTPFG